MTILVDEAVFIVLQGNTGVFMDDDTLYLLRHAFADDNVARIYKGIFWNEPIGV